MKVGDGEKNNKIGERFKQKMEIQNISSVASGDYCVR
jgi:hypothetical protein